MRTLWVHRTIDAPSSDVWGLLTELDSWPEWGPTVRSARLESDEFDIGARGVVTTLVGVDLPFEITSFTDGAQWGWKVAGIPATEHTVESIGPRRCRAGFGVPWPAVAYLSVCRVALGRLDTLATGDEQS